MSKLVTIAESDIYFNKLKDRPELIKHYIEAKSVTEFINKAQEAQEIMNLYINILRSCYDLISKMRDIIISTNVSTPQNLEIVSSTLKTYSEELDNSIMSMTYKKKKLLGGYTIKSKSIDGFVKCNVKKMGDELLNFSSFYWEGTCVQKNDSGVIIEWNKKILIDENKWSLKYDTGKVLVEYSNSYVTCHNNFDIEINLNEVEILDTIIVDTILDYNFIVGENQSTTSLFFPRIGTGIYGINQKDIENDKDNNFKNIENNLIVALNNVNQYIGLSGSQINVISMTIVNLKNRFNGLMTILNNYRENI